MAMNKKKTTIAVRTPAPLPAVLGEGYEAVAGAGFETATSDAYALPRLLVLQKGSPQVNPKQAEHVKGAEAGMFFNPVSQHLYKELFAVIVLYRRTYVEWVRRDAGGGFVAEHASVQLGWERQARGPFLVPKTDNIVNDTRNFFILFGETPQELEENPQEVVVSLTASNLQVSANLMTVLGNKRGKRKDGSMFQLPMYASKFAMGTEWRENDQGDWFRYKFIDLTELVAEDSPLFNMAKAYHAKISGGLVTMRAPVADADAADTM